MNAIDKLPRNIAYDYPNSRTKTKIEIVRVEKPEGPIFVKRYNPSKKQGPKEAKSVSLSTQMIWRVANAIVEGKPVNIDRALGGSYNTRSVLEALLLHTPEFYNCYPGRIELIDSSSKIKQGHKHLLWMPDEPHRSGIIQQKKTDIIISEVSSEARYEALELPYNYAGEGISLDIARRHAQIQVALIMIGEQLGFRSWIAHNDKGILYQNKRIGEMTSVVSRLEDEKLLGSYSEAVKAAHLIDCIWFRNSHFMPAVIEIEHSTGVTSGLTRMKNFYDHIPALKDVRWVIVAPDEDRDKVLKEANKPQFKPLEAQYLSYSAVEELFSLCQRRKIRGVNDQFLDCFMEPCLSSIN